MGRRALAWALTTPVAAVGVLLAHAVAYRLTGTEPGSAHAYLAHAPQVLVLLATIALVGLAYGERSLGRRSAWAFSLVAPVGFACQEHVERFAHTGELPWLLTTPTFLLGLALQVPVALACVLVARRVAGTLTGGRRRRPASLSDAWLPLSTRPAARPGGVRPSRACGRAPPRPLPS